jgi:four helix bundle protein
MASKKNSIIRKKAMDFSVRMFHLNDYLIKQRKFSLADQVFRSGTSIGANLSEAFRAESDSDYVHKYSIAMKEAEETMYWLELAYRVDLLDEKLYQSLRSDCEELIKMGTSTILTMLRNIKTAKEDNHN